MECIAALAPGELCGLDDGGAAAGACAASRATGLLERTAAAIEELEAGPPIEPIKEQRCLEDLWLEQPACVAGCWFTGCGRKCVLCERKPVARATRFSLEREPAVRNAVVSLAGAATCPPCLKRTCGCSPAARA